MNEQHPQLVSIVIPTFQHGSSLKSCLDSVLAQTYRNIEIIVVNDGSTDNTKTVLDDYSDRILVIHQENRGSNRARNRGLEEAKGEYVIFCDADVRMNMDMIEKLVATLQDNPKASIAYSGFTFGWKTFKGVPFDAEHLKKMNFIHTTSLVRRDDFPGFDPSIHRLQDWDVWLTMLAEGRTGVLVPEILFSISVDGASRIGSSWLPSFLYKIPWRFLGWQPHQIKKYEAAREILRNKHKL